jgi:hypothetical protein
MISTTALHQNIVAEFLRLPPSPRNLTFMQVAGYSHYENVCSNILAFYLDPQEEHDLGDLVLNALLEVAGDAESSNIESARILREHVTPRDQRIDLVIKSEGLVVGIENKIYHWLANDLTHYSEVLEELGKPDSRVVKIVLGLRANGQPLSGGFRSVTYLQLWDAVEHKLGRHLARASQKWLNYLTDFIQTTRNLSQRNMELLPNDQFFIENNQAIKKLINEHEQFIGRLHERVSCLHSMIYADDQCKSLGLSKEPWIWQKNCLVFDFQFHGLFPVAIDLYLTPSGWELQIFARKGGEAFLSRLFTETPHLKEYANAELTDKGRRVIHRWPVDADLTEIERSLLNVLRSLDMSARSLPQALEPTLPVTS